MSKSNRKIKLYNFIIFLVLLSFILYFIDDFNIKVKVSNAIKGEIEDKILVNGILFKDETIIKSNVDGRVKFFFNEGEKVKRGKLIMDIYTDNSSQNLNKELDDINIAIDNKENKKNTEVSINENIYENVELEIQNAVLNKNIQDIYNFIDEMEYSSDNYYSKNDYTNYSLNELYKLKNELTSSMENKKIPYYSNCPGIISYKFDGLEEIYALKKLEQLSVSDIKILDTSTINTLNRTGISRNQVVLKLINNFKYYIVVKLSNNQIKNFEENTYIKTRIISAKNKDIIYAYIKKINYGSEESVLILEYNDYFYKYYDRRYVEVELIKNTYEGIILKSSTITKKDNLTGVYVKDISNIVKFFPILIIGNINDKVIVSEGEKINAGSRGIIEIDNKKYYTIKNYDKIILKPEKVYEGQIVK